MAWPVIAQQQCMYISSAAAQPNSREHPGPMPLTTLLLTNICMGVLLKPSKPEMPIRCPLPSSDGSTYSYNLGV
jgi:hypothetical protein